MRWILVGFGAVTATAFAEPATPTAFEACKARRHEIAMEAMTIRDANARAARYETMPSCERREDGTLAVTVPAPPRVDTTPFAPRITAAARVGASVSAILDELAPSGVGPYVELEVGYHVRRHLELAAMFAYTNFRDPMVVDRLTGRVFDVAEASFDASARANMRYGNVTFGAGLGVEYQRFPNTSYETALPLVELHASYTFARASHVRAHVFATVTDGLTLFSTNNGDLVSARLGLGVAY